MPFEHDALEVFGWCIGIAKGRIAHEAELRIKSRLAQDYAALRVHGPELGEHTLDQRLANAGPLPIGPDANGAETEPSCCWS